MNTFKCLLLSGLVALLPVCAGAQTSSEDTTKPRVIITCDPELDDNNSLIRFLLFSTDRPRAGRQQFAYPLPAVQHGLPGGGIDLCQQPVPLER